MASETFERLNKHKKIRILTAAKKEFSERIYEEAKVVNICKSAGIPRITFYSYFSTLGDLYEYVYQTVCDKYTSDNHSNCSFDSEDWEWEVYFMKLVESDKGQRLLYKTMQSAPAKNRLLHHLIMSLSGQLKLKLISREEFINEFSRMRTTLLEEL
ncbi:TetR/AcrR family transcriptional regulator [Labilibacter sediminis]|nr:TetR/AcrR family transcriptional regulator [Labilibacter sediminis]